MLLLCTNFYKNRKYLDLNKKIWQWASLLLLSFIWGTSFILIKKSLLAFTPYQSGALRISFAFLYFLPFAFKRIRKINKKNITPLLICGFIGNFFPAFLFAYGETTISSSLASMINSTTPIFVLIIGIILYQTKVRWQNILGLFIGFVGTLGLVFNPADLTSFWNIGAIIVLLASVFYGINTNEIKYKLSKLDGLSISVLTYSLIGPFAIAYFFTTDISTALQSEFLWKSIYALLALSFFSSFIAVILFNILIKHTTPIFAASVTYLIPVFAIGWGFFDGEIITYIQIISIVIILAGVSLVNKRQSNSRQSCSPQ